MAGGTAVVMNFPEDEPHSRGKIMINQGTILMEKRAVC